MVKVSICNLFGKEIRTLVEKVQPAGTYALEFSGGLLPAGFYICRLKAGAQTETARLVKLK